jgi:hypothetical protein
VAAAVGQAEEGKFRHLQQAGGAVHRRDVVMEPSGRHRHRSQHLPFPARVADIIVSRLDVGSWQSVSGGRRGSVPVRAGLDREVLPEIGTGLS